MSSVFLSHLCLPEPDYSLEIGSGTHGYQTGIAIISLERLFDELKPSIVIVVGDVNSTLAAALAASKLGIAVAHIEAGLRSFDRSMPEEINRILTDAISDILFTTCIDANGNLEREGVDSSKVFLTGNVMIDSLISALPEIESSTVVRRLGLSPGDYIYVTLHRPSNVDDEDTLRGIIKAFDFLVGLGIKIAFPVHPRTKKMLHAFHLHNIVSEMKGLLILDPLGYLDSMAFMKDAKLVLTDSGGIQEETTYLGIPCLTLRPSTERPITITEGTNILLDRGPEMIPAEVEKILNGDTKKGIIPYLWDGNASVRIVDILTRFT